MRTCFRNLPATLAVLAVLAVFALPAWAAPTVHRAKDFVGTSELNDGKNTMTWRSFFPVSADVALKGMTAWDKHLVLVENGESLEVKERSATGALLYIERGTPFFMPDFKILIRAVVSSPAPGESLITWTQVEGPANAVKRTWHLRPTAGGTFIEHRTELDLPFTPPAFMFGDVADKLANQVAAVRGLVGAKHSAATPPKAAREPAQK